MPVVEPTPLSADYGEMVRTTALAPVGLPTGLGRVLKEIAAETSIPVAPSRVDGHGQASVTVTTGDTGIPSQAYRLDIAPTPDGPAATVHAGDEAGALNGLLSLARLLVADGGAFWLRAAHVEDAAGFRSRGAILDPWVKDAGGVTAESRAALLDRIRLGARYKMNLLNLAGRDIWPELLAFCSARHIEVMSPLGYRASLTTTPRDELKWRLGQLLDQGGRSFEFACDDMVVEDAATLAPQHAEVFRDLYDFVRRRDGGVRVSAVLPPYGGLPHRNLIGAKGDEGERYLALIREALPSDVRVFWTGDDGDFSARITAAGARSYADAIGHELGVWDNDAIRFAAGRYPLSGRDPDLGAEAPTYMGNLAGEWAWGESNGRFALLTSLMYAWNPGAYDPFAARDAAERIIASA